MAITLGLLKRSGSSPWWLSNLSLLLVEAGVSGLIVEATSLLIPSIFPSPCPVLSEVERFEAFVGLRSRLSTPGAANTAVVDAFRNDSPSAPVLTLALSSLRMSNDLFLNIGGKYRGPSIDWLVVMLDSSRVGIVPLPLSISCSPVLS